MRISEAFPSNYLRATDLQGKNVTAIIDRVELEEIGGEHKPVIYFRGKEKGLVCNKTNANNIAAAYGDDTDGWTDGEIVLFPAMVDFQGRTVEAIRVRVPPRRPAPAQRVAATAGPRVVASNEPPPNDGRHLDDDIPF